MPEMKKLSLVLVVAAVLAGCGENTPVQTVDWYKAHDTERKAMRAAPLETAPLAA